MVRRASLLLFSSALLVLTAALPAAATNPDTRVSIGSPTTPFSSTRIPSGSARSSRTSCRTR